MADLTEQAFFGLLKFFFKLVIVWPIKLLWFLGNWLYDLFLTKRADASQRKFEADQAASQQRQDAERRSRSTLYSGSTQSDA